MHMLFRDIAAATQCHSLRLPCGFLPEGSDTHSAKTRFLTELFQGGPHCCFVVRQGNLFGQVLKPLIQFTASFD